MKVLMSLTPLATARTETHEATGIKFSLAALSGDREAELQRECTSVMGVYDSALFTKKVCMEVIKGWEGFGVNGVAVQCSEENLKTFVTYHGQTIGPWVVVRARSYDHYRVAEVGEAKKD